MNKLRTPFVTFVLAKNAPVGVIVAAFNGRLSRVYKWDLETDTITPGQFLKARAFAYSISLDGKYFAYHAEALAKRDQTYMCIAHAGYFSALAFFPHHPCGSGVIVFLENGNIIASVNRENLDYIKGYEQIQERITPGYPHEFIRDYSWEELQKFLPEQRKRLGLSGQLPIEDSPRSRTIHVVGPEIQLSTDTPGERKVLFKCLREPFIEIPPPDWVTQW